MESVADIIRGIDLFGSHIYITYRNTTKVKNIMGGVFTIILGIFTVVLIYLFSKDIFLKNKPFIRFNDDFLQVNETEMDISTDFPLIISISDKEGFSISNITKYLNVTPYLRHKFIEDGNVKIYDSYNSKFVECDPNKHFGSYNDTIENSLLLRKNSFCIEHTNQTKLLYKDGGIGSRSFGLHFDICNNTNSVESSSCLDPIEIEHKLGFFTVSILYPENVFNPKNFNVPIVKSIGEITFYGSFYSYSNFKMSFRKLQVVTDVGWFSEELHSINSTTLDDKNSDPLTRDNISLINIVFSSSSFSNTYNRSYIKLQEILASIGGVLNIIYIIGSIILRYIARTNFYLQLAKRTLYYNGIESGEEELQDEPLRSDITLFYPIPTENKQVHNANLVSLNSEYTQGKTEIEPVILMKLNNNEGERRISKKSVAQQYSSNNSKPNPRRPSSEAFKDNTLNTQQHVKRKSFYHEKKLGRTLNELKIQKKEERIKRDDITFMLYLNNECFKKNKSHSNFYEALIEYLENQLDVRTIIKTKYDLEILKFLFFSARDDYEELFNLKVPIEEVLYYYDSLGTKSNSLDNSKDEIVTQEKNNKLLHQMRNNLLEKKLFE